MAINILDPNHELLGTDHSKMSIENIFSVQNIKKAFTSKISKRASRGIDGTTLKQFDLDKESVLIHEKCVKGEYKFSPYLQKLVLKGKGKPPRVISIPTIRDQIILFVLKEYLHLVFSSCINKTLPNAVIRDVCSYLKAASMNQTLCYSKYDVDNFYGSLDQNRLMGLLGEIIHSEQVLSLLKTSITNITVPSTCRKEDFRSFRSLKGIPQGLSVSNILANIYIQEFDKEAYTSFPKYFRYVDDILIFNFGEAKECLKPVVEKKLKAIGLEISKGKTCCKSVAPEFDYLGYSFSAKVVSVKQANIDKFIRSIADRFTAFINKKGAVVKNHKWMTLDVYKGVFIQELNIKITGAISGKKRYGWVFYFQEMDDLTLLKSMDNVIKKQFLRTSDFGGEAPDGVKTLCRTYHEAKYNAMGGYIHDYDKIITTKEKLDYLVKMGVVNKESDEALSVEQIDIQFDLTKAHYLSLLELDVGGFS